MDAHKPKGFGEFDKLARKLAQVPPSEMEPPMDGEIAIAAHALSHSEHGRQAMRDIFKIVEYVTHQEASSAAAAFTLISAVFGGSPEKALHAMREALGLK